LNEPRFHKGSVVELHAIPPIPGWPVGFDIETPFQARIEGVVWNDGLKTYLYTLVGRGTINQHAATFWGNIPEAVLMEPRL
jgi:hypothetical protein